MKDVIARANIDQCLELLKRQDLPPAEAAGICNTLIAEENKLSFNQSQLEFAESRTAEFRARVRAFRRLRDQFAAGSAGRMQANLTLSNFEWLLDEAEKLCKLLRKRVRANSLSYSDQQRRSNVHRGVTYSILRAEAGIWNWEFRIGDDTKRGRLETRLDLLAERRVQSHIDRELRARRIKYGTE